VEQAKVFIKLEAETVNVNPVSSSLEIGTPFVENPPSTPHSYLLLFARVKYVSWASMRKPVNSCVALKLNLNSETALAIGRRNF
jgi:hypothetical protein